MMDQIDNNMDGQVDHFEDPILDSNGAMTTNTTTSTTPSSSSSSKPTSNDHDVDDDHDDDVDDVDDDEDENEDDDTTKNNNTNNTNNKTQKYHIEDDDNQDGGDYPSLKDEEMSSDTRLDGLLVNRSILDQHTIIYDYLKNGVCYPFVAQWRNSLVSSIKENVIVKSVAQFNPYFGCIMVAEPLYEYEEIVSSGSSTRGDAGSDSEFDDGGKASRFKSHSKKKYKKMSVSDLSTTGYYVMATDLYGMKKKSVIGRILDDHRKFVKRCLLVNHIKCTNEAGFLELCKHECETRIPNLNTISEAFPSNIRLKSSDHEGLRKVVEVFQSHGGKPPQKLSKKVDVAQVLNLSDVNKRITTMCPEGTGCLNDLNTLVKYITTCMTFPFTAKAITRYSFLNEQQIEFTLKITTVNYRCKQGVIFKGTVSSAELQALDYKYMVKGGEDEADIENEDRPKKRRRIASNLTANTPTDAFNGREIKVDASQIKLCGEVTADNLKIMTDYQVWFCHSILLDEKKLDDQWNNLRYYLQFIH